MKKTEPKARPLGEQLAEARREHGMSQEELGESVGAAGRTVSTWETGVHAPTRRVQATLEVLYGWPRGTIAHAIRTGVELPPVARHFTPGPPQAEGAADGSRSLALQHVTDALELLAGKVSALEERVSQLEAPRARRSR